MFHSKNAVLNSSKVFDLSLISSILFVILLFSVTSSGFDIKSDIVNTISEKSEIYMIPRFKEIEPRPPKPVEAKYEMGEIKEEEFIEPIEIEPDESFPEPAEIIPEIPIDDTGEEIWEISLAPKLEIKVAPKYPNLAKRLNLEATVFIEYILDKNGHPTHCKVVSGNVMFNDAALTALKQFRFAPGIQNGEAVRVKMRQTFKFSLK